MRHTFRPPPQRRRKRNYAGALIVSAAAFGGIPAGNDATGAGTLVAPYATLTKALTIAAAGQSIWLNGDPNAPSEYRAATVYTVTKGVAIDAINPFGAIISATTAASRVMLLNVPAGQTLRFGKVIIDGRSVSNTGLDMSVNPVKYSVVVNGSQIRNCLLYGIGGASTNYNYDLTVNNVVFTAASMRAAVYCNGLASGSVRVANSTINIGRSTSGFGAIHIAAVAASVSVAVAWNNITSASTTGLIGTGAVYGIYCVNVRGAIISDNSISHDTTAKTNNAVGVYLAAITANPLDCSGFAINGNAIYCDTTSGGMGIQVGQDGSPAGIVNANLLSNGAISSNKISCSNQARAQTFHGIYHSQNANTDICRNWVENCGIGIVNQETNNARIFSNICIGFTSSAILFKGAQNTRACFNTAIFDGSINSIGVSLHANPHIQSAGDIDNAVINCGNNAIYANNFYCAGSARATFIDADTNNTAGLAIRDNNYFAANPAWVWQSANSANYAAWTIASNDAGSTVANPLMAAAPNKNYALAASSSLRARVNNIDGAYADYAGAPIVAAAVIGAYQ